ncbi:hypothetical protein [Streptomyces sp. IBSBF 3010]|uniref:hypothetical protein n=1 Tax=Streptomyces sp. IBSBF 3010 TaxID=2903526 RepID=UPI002FDBE66C
MNVVKGSGKVHYNTSDDVTAPACNPWIGAQGFRGTDQPVTCLKCLTYMEKEAERKAEAAAAETTSEISEEATTEETTEETANVVSYTGGKVHTMMPGTEEHPYPLCRGGGMNQNLTKFRTISAPLTCKTCLTYEERRAAAAGTTSEISEATGHQAPESANVPSVSTTNKGETMAENTTTEAPKLDVTTDEGKAALEQIAANIERGRVLATEDNAEALEELGTETETLISNLSGKGSIKAKKENRDAWKSAVAEAAAAKPKAEVAKKAAEGVVVAKTWDQYEGTKEFATLGAEKLAEGVRLNLKVANVAEEVAKYAFEMVVRIPNKDGNPDLMVASDVAKKAGTALLGMAGEGFEHTWDNEQALKKFARSVQDYRSDARAAWLRSLDEETEEAAERRARVAKVLEGKPDDVPASEWVAKAYGTSTIGQAERKRLAYHEKQKAKELAAAGGSAEGGNGEGGEGDGEGSGEGTSAETTTPDERVTKLTDKLLKDLGAAKPEDFEAASDETKEAIRERLEKASKALKAMIAATL